MKCLFKRLWSSRVTLALITSTIAVIIIVVLIHSIVNITASITHTLPIFGYVALWVGISCAAYGTLCLQDADTDTDYDRHSSIEATVITIYGFIISVIVLWLLLAPIF